MKRISDLVEATGTTKQQSDSLGFNHSKEGMAKCWRALLAMRLQTEEVGSTDFMYWHHGLREYSDKELMGGVKKARDFDGYLTLGKFRDMCKPVVLHVTHKPFQALPKPRMTVEQRKAAMAKLRAEVGI